MLQFFLPEFEDADSALAEAQSPIGSYPVRSFHSCRFGRWNSGALALASAPCPQGTRGKSSASVHRPGCLALHRDGISGGWPDSSDGGCSARRSTLASFCHHARIRVAHVDLCVRKSVCLSRWT